MGPEIAKQLIIRLKRLVHTPGDKPQSSFLSFRILYLCIFLPPVLYIFTIQGLERYLNNSWNQEFSSILISDMSGVVTGQTRLQDEVHNNVEIFITGQKLRRLGVMVQASVRTGHGRQLYPAFDLQTGLDEHLEGRDGHHLDELRKSLVARENISILQEGLIYNLSVRIPHNTWLSNIILIFYILSFSLVLYRIYHQRVHLSELAAQKQQEELELTRSRLAQAQSFLNEYSDKEKTYTNELESLRKDLEAADDRLKLTEDEALAEIELLEKKLSDATAQRETQELEILNLNDHLEKLSKDIRQKDKKRQKLVDQQLKRFSTLYKRLKFHDKAIQGFMDLPSDLQLKAEEVIHTLNEDLQKVSVKRKVFSRGNETSFETEFAYRGRIYWSRNPQGQAEVLTIGTKNTQTKDLKYLEGLNRD
ncbi:hypothetical protein [Desulfonatronovibrio hydrogenovorans]|uniref:hypothetical protein n=1 Tax=Desulfonatronovibrio hydrogenovorans TaxID=53245 RepID=UPI00049064F0|nr:hypothetical protein [Desulfonatronovibrio hydrogenovorans]